MPHQLLNPTTALFYSQSAPLDDRPPLILIHGVWSEHLTWPAALRHHTSWPVLALDLPGHGQSTGSGCDTIEAYADAVLAWLDRLNITRAVIAGHSMGGAIAQTIALRAPDRLAGLALVSTGANLPVSPWLIETLENDFSKAVELVVYWSFGPKTPPKLLEAIHKNMLAANPKTPMGDFIACKKFDVRNDIHQWSGPTLVMCGELDKTTPVKYSQELIGLLQNAWLRLIPEAGHMLLLECPEELTATLANFLTSTLTVGQ